jgi:hypothetical protein
MDIALILSEKYPGKEWHLIGDDYSGLNWLSETDKPTLSEISELWTEVQAEQLAVKETKAAARSSALAKLAALGLTEEEIAEL